MVLLTHSVWIIVTAYLQIKWLSQLCWIF